MTTVLAGDIGGTNARFVLFRDGKFQTETFQVMPVGEYHDLGDAVADYLTSQNVGSPDQATFSFASTHEYCDEMALTNSKLTVSVSGLVKRFKLQRARVVNDFTAAAVGILSLSASELQEISAGVIDPLGPKAVLGPGTGLGVSGLIYTGEFWLPLQSQGGHVSMAGQNERELQVYRHMASVFGHVSAERYLSGPGTVNLYAALRSIDGLPIEYTNASEITSRAMTGECASCVETMQIFCRWLGVIAGNLAVTLGSTGGIYLAGGIVPQLGDYFLQSGFVEALQYKGRFSEFVAEMPVYLVKGGDPALYGSVTCLKNHYDGFGFTVDG
ncbi:glucokinase [Chromatiales bacterium (ex Bugula neritina AB1)]|nr:glucokinase [Chromatiales bacterium (ex Bugula neritina AB1)]